MNGVRIELPADVRYLVLARLAVTGVGRAHRMPEDAVDDLRLAVTEAVGNAMRHAYPGGAGSVLLELEPVGVTLRAAVTDTGVGFDARAVAASARPPESGLGLAILAAIAPDLAISSVVGSGTRLVFSVPLEGPQRSS